MYLKPCMRSTKSFRNYKELGQLILYKKLFNCPLRILDGIIILITENTVKWITSRFYVHRFVWIGFDGLIKRVIRYNLNLKKFKVKYPQVDRFLNSTGWPIYSISLLLWSIIL